jgi:hypothetical protein
MAEDVMRATTTGARVREVAQKMCGNDEVIRATARFPETVGDDSADHFTLANAIPVFLDTG